MFLNLLSWLTMLFYIICVSFVVHSSHSPFCKVHNRTIGFLNLSRNDISFLGVLMFPFHFTQYLLANFSFPYLAIKLWFYTRLQYSRCFYVLIIPWVIIALQQLFRILSCFTLHRSISKFAFNNKEYVRLYSWFGIVFFLL